MSAGSSGAATAAGTATSALCLLLSLTAVAVCLLLGAKTAELQGRLAALEERGAAGPGPLLDALQPRVEQLFREVSGGAAPQHPRAGSTHRRAAPAGGRAGPAAPGREGDRLGKGASAPLRRGEPGARSECHRLLWKNFLPFSELFPFLLPFALVRL